MITNSSIPTNFTFQVLPDVIFNQTETTFDCPWFHTCTTFDTLADCEAQKQISSSTMECVKNTINRTVEYVKKCVVGIQEECKIKCSDSSHRRCASNAITCTSIPITQCSVEATGKFVDGPITVQGVKESGVFTDEPLSYVQILGFVVVAFVILGGILSLKEHIETRLEKNKLHPTKVKLEKTT